MFFYNDNRIICRTIMLAFCFTKGKIALLAAPLSMIVIGLHLYNWIVVQVAIVIYRLITVIFYAKSKEKKYLKENIGFYASCTSIATGLVITY